MAGKTNKPKDEISALAVLKARSDRFRMFGLLATFLGFIGFLYYIKAVVNGNLNSNGLLLFLCIMTLVGGLYICIKGLQMRRVIAYYKEFIDFKDRHPEATPEEYMETKYFFKNLYNTRALRRLMKSMEVYHNSQNKGGE